MPNTAIQRLAFLCQTIPARLREMDEPSFTAKPAPDKWSKKKIWVT